MFGNNFFDAMYLFIDLSSSQIKFESNCLLKLYPKNIKHHKSSKKHQRQKVVVKNKFRFHIFDQKMYKPIKRATESDSVFAYFVLSSHADGFVIFLRYALLHYLNE